MPIFRDFQKIEAPIYGGFERTCVRQRFARDISSGHVITVLKEHVLDRDVKRDLINIKLISVLKEHVLDRDETNKAFLNRHNRLERTCVGQGCQKEVVDHITFSCFE